MGVLGRSVWSGTHPLDLSFAHEKPRLAWPGSGFDLEVILWCFVAPNLVRQTAKQYKGCCER